MDGWMDGWMDGFALLLRLPVVLLSDKRTGWRVEDGGQRMDDRRPKLLLRLPILLPMIRG